MQTLQPRSHDDTLRPGQFTARFTPRRLPRINSPFVRDVLAGLSRPQKEIPSTWLYDRRGCELFEAITRLDAYYPTRTESAILERCAAQIAAAAGPGATLVELGSVAGCKPPMLLAALDAPNAYVSVDVSADGMAESMAALQTLFPKLPMHTIVGDIADPATLAPLRRSVGALARASRSARPWGRRLGFCPSSTIGNFAPDVAAALLDRIGQALGDDAMLVVGVDATLDRSVVLPAYDDRAGVTAAFNKNLLVRINRELEGDFDPAAFRHEARFDAPRQRVEMHLVSKTWETFEVMGRRVSFPAGESIHTMDSYKYSLTRFQALAQRSGWTPIQFWTDARAHFGVHVLERSRVA